MNYLYLIIFDENLTEINQLQNSIKRYLKYLKNQNIKVNVFGRLNCEESLLRVDKLKLNSEISFYFISFQEILSEIYRKEYDFVNVDSPIVYLWKEKIKYLKYYDLVQQFKHGAKSDLVNSELGLLNVCCINKDSKFIEKDHIKSCVDILNNINSKFSIEVKFEKIFSELKLIIFYTNQIKLILEKKGSEINCDDYPAIKNNLSQIFNFVSKYKNEPETKHLNY